MTLHFISVPMINVYCLGINLQIRNLDIDDAGNYICEVENEAEPIQQTNQLQILGNPLWPSQTNDLRGYNINNVITTFIS